MLIAIISDIHDNLVNLEKCLGWCLASGVEEIICCGDVTNSQTLNYLANTFTNPIHLASGNMEIFRDEDARRLDNINYFGKIGRIEIGEKWVGICHEPWRIKDVLKLGKCDIIFYGHTHKPWENVEMLPSNTAGKHGASVRLVNPGNLAGVLHKATFAVWDTETDKLELKMMDTLNL